MRRSPLAVASLLGLVVALGFMAAVPAYAGYDKFYRFTNSTGSPQNSVRATMMGLEVIGAQFTDPAFNPWGEGTAGTQIVGGVYCSTIEWSGASALTTAMKLGWNSTDHSLQLRDLRWGSGASITPSVDNSSVPGGGVLEHVPGWYRWTIINDTAFLLRLGRPDGTSTVEAGSFAGPLGSADLSVLSEQGISGGIIAALQAEVRRASGTLIPAPSANSLLKKLAKAADALNLALRALEQGNMTSFNYYRAAAVKAMETFVSELRTSNKIPLDYRNWLAAKGDEAIARIKALPQGAIPAGYGGGSTIPHTLYPIGDPRGPSSFTLTIPDGSVNDGDSLVIHGSVVDQTNSIIYVDWVDRVEVKTDLVSPVLTVSPSAADVGSLNAPPATFQNPNDKVTVTVTGSDIGTGVVGLYVLEGQGTPPNTIPGLPQYVTGSQVQRKYGLGTHWLAAVARDGAGNLSDQKVVKVRVIDTKAPTLTAPADVTAEQANRNGTAVDIGQATATDPWDPAPVITNNAPSVFPLGVTVVTWKATDKSGNMVTADQTVTVVDTTKPTLTVPAAVTAEQTSAAGTPVAIGEATATDICDADVTIANDALSVFPLGETTVTWTATDDAGNQATGTQKVTVVDTTPPVLTVPAAVSAEQTSRAGTPVDIGQATATDICDANPAIASNAPAVFPLGATTVTWTATDASGNRATGTQEVTVVDTTPPDLTVPADIRQEQTSLAGTEKVNLGTATATDICDADVAITNNAPATFPLGTTVVKWTATDDSGNKATGAQRVTVVDTTPPTLVVPANISKEQTSLAGTPVDIGQATATDICDAAPAVANDAPAVFPLGETTVTWTATDDSGNQATAKQTVTVVDTTPPALAPLANLSVEQTDRAGTPVTLTAPGATDICDRDPVVASNAPAVFPLGETTVTWTATDSSGNKATATQTVTVVDTTSPTLTVPADVAGVEQANRDGTAVAIGTATATDICDAAPAVTHNAPAVFPLGATTVTWTATDASGNKATGAQKVTVVDTTVPTIQTLTANPNAIWSPNHKIVTVTVTAVSTDVCDAAPTCKISRIECPQGGASQITGDLTVKLDAWRDPQNPDGRLYTIHVICTDASGNKSAEKTVEVRVAHDQGTDKPFGAAAVSSLSAVPTPAGAQIVFALGAPSQVTVTVMNLAGRPVRTVCDAKTFDAGMNTLTWNAQADNGLRVPSGIYLISLTANSPDGTTSRAISPLRLDR